MPMAFDAGKYFSFALSIVSLHEEMMYGSSMTLSSMAAASTQEPVCTPIFIKSFTSSTRPIKPYITEGIPASRSMNGYSSSRAFRGATQDRNSAAPMPTAEAIIIARSDT